MTEDPRPAWVQIITARQALESNNPDDPYYQGLLRGRRASDVINQYEAELAARKAKEEQERLKKESDSTKTLETQKQLKIDQLEQKIVKSNINLNAKQALEVALNRQRIYRGEPTQVTPQDVRSNYKWVNIRGKSVKVPTDTYEEQKQKAGIAAGREAQTWVISPEDTTNIREAAKKADRESLAAARDLDASQISDSELVAYSQNKSSKQYQFEQGIDLIRGGQVKKGVGIIGGGVRVSTASPDLDRQTLTDKGEVQKHLINQQNLTWNLINQQNLIWNLAEAYQKEKKKDGFIGLSEDIDKFIGGITLKTDSDDSYNKMFLKEMYNFPIEMGGELVKTAGAIGYEGVYFQQLPWYGGMELDNPKLQAYTKQIQAANQQITFTWAGFKIFKAAGKLAPLVFGSVSAVEGLIAGKPEAIPKGTAVGFGTAGVVKFGDKLGGVIQAFDKKTYNVNIRASGPYYESRRGLIVPINFESSIPLASSGRSTVRSNILGQGLAFVTKKEGGGFKVAIESVDANEFTMTNKKGLGDMFPKVGGNLKGDLMRAWVDKNYVKPEPYDWENMAAKPPSSAGDYVIRSLINKDYTGPLKPRGKNPSIEITPLKILAFQEGRSKIQLTKIKGVGETRTEIPALTQSRFLTVVGRKGKIYKDYGALTDMLKVDKGDTVEFTTAARSKALIDIFGFTVEAGESRGVIKAEFLQEPEIIRLPELAEPKTPAKPSKRAMKNFENIEVQKWFDSLAETSRPITTQEFGKARKYALTSREKEVLIAKYAQKQESPIINEEIINEEMQEETGQQLVKLGLVPKGPALKMGYGSVNLFKTSGLTERFIERTGQRFIERTGQRFIERTGQRFIERTATRTGQRYGQRPAARTPFEINPPREPPRIPPPDSDLYSADLFNERPQRKYKHKPSRIRKRYVPDLTGILGGRVKGKAPKFVFGFESQPLYTNKTNRRRRRK